MEDEVRTPRSARPTGPTMPNRRPPERRNTKQRRHKKEHTQQRYLLLKHDRHHNAFAHSNTVCIGTALGGLLTFGAGGGDGTVPPGCNADGDSVSACCDGPAGLFGTYQVVLLRIMEVHTAVRPAGCCPSLWQVCIHRMQVHL